MRDKRFWKRIKSKTFTFDTLMDIYEMADG